MSNKSDLGDLEMLEQASAKPAVNTMFAEAKPTARSKVSNGKSLFLQRDGRSRASRRFRDALAALISDMGGVDCMSKARRQLCRSFAALTVQGEMLESRLGQGVEVHVTEYSTISSTPACAEARYRS
jgi:hypothetical protein